MAILQPGTCTCAGTIPGYPQHEASCMISATRPWDEDYGWDMDEQFLSYIEDPTSDPGEDPGENEEKS